MNASLQTSQALSGTDYSGYRRLREWYAQPLGRELGEVEQAALCDSLSTIFGYHLLAVAPPWQGNPLSASTIPHRILLECDHSSPTPGGSLIGHPECLPVATDSLDAILLPHTLDVSADPHQVLREVDRCLIPEGHLILLGFCPLSAWGAYRLLRRRSGNMPWALHFMGQTRIQDWLSLLGFQTLHVQPLFYRPPIRNMRAQTRLAFLERLAQRGWPVPPAVYLLVARKRQVGMTPIRPSWRSRRRVLGPGIVEPTPRSSQCGR